MDLKKKKRLELIVHISRNLVERNEHGSDDSELEPGPGLFPWLSTSGLHV